MNSRSFVFLGILLAAVIVVSSAVEVEQSKDVDKAEEEVVDPSYCGYRYCCRRGYYGCQRYCCGSSQAEADEKDLTGKPEEESKDVKPDRHRGGGGGRGGRKGGGGKGGGGGGGGYDESGETFEADMKAGGRGKGGGKGGKGGGGGGKGGGGGGYDESGETFEADMKAGQGGGKGKGGGKGERSRGRGGKGGGGKGGGSKGGGGGGGGKGEEAVQEGSP